MLPIVLDQRAVPEVVGMSVEVDAATRTSKVWWESVLVRGKAPWRFDGTYWSAQNLTTVYGWEWSVNTGELSTTAFAFQVGTSRVKFHDATSSRAFRECHVVVNTALAATVAPTFEHSTDGNSWTAVTATLRRATVNADNPDLTTFVYDWTTGNANWWAVRASGTMVVTQVWFREYGDAFTDIASIDIYDTRSGSRQLYASLLPGNFPTSSNPHTLAEITTWSETASADAGSVSIDVVVKKKGGKASVGFSISGDDSVAVPTRYVTSIGGNTGAVSSGTIAAMAPVQSVGGNTGAISSGTIAAMAPVQSVGGNTGVISTGTISAMAPVQQVVGRTGNVTLSVTDLDEDTIGSGDKILLADGGSGEVWLPELPLLLPAASPVQVDCYVRGYADAAGRRIGTVIQLPLPLKGGTWSISSTSFDAGLNSIFPQYGNEFFSQRAFSFSVASIAAGDCWAHCTATLTSA